MSDQNNCMLCTKSNSFHGLDSTLIHVSNDKKFRNIFFWFQNNFQFRAEYSPLHVPCHELKYRLAYFQQLWMPLLQNCFWVFEINHFSCLKIQNCTNNASTYWISCRIEAFAILDIFAKNLLLFSRDRISINCQCFLYFHSHMELDICYCHNIVKTYSMGDLFWKMYCSQNILTAALMKSNFNHWFLVTIPKA